MDFNFTYFWLYLSARIIVFMRKTIPVRLILLLIVLVFTGCKKADKPDPPEVSTNPFTGVIEWNGFVFDTTRYHTPHAYIENWGENLDSLSTDYDIKITDGTFDEHLHDVKDYSILVYFDANSPSVHGLSEGTYTVEDTYERKPGNIVDAWVELYSNDKLYKFKVTRGSVMVKGKDGYTLITYDAELDNAHRLKGQYTGKIDPILQVIK